MARSHPPTALTLCRRTWLEEIRLEQAACVVVAVSGGVDSMVLLHLLARLAKELEIRVWAHGVDHGLRAEASRELDVAQAFAAKLGVPFERTRVELTAGGNLQARARRVRYSALRAAAEAAGAAFIATAHHADDRAETVLLRLLRGTSAGGLGVLPARSGDLLRPLIRARRAALLAHAGRHQIPFVEDPSNADSRFQRVRVRRELLPLLSDLSPGIVENLNALADECLLEALPELWSADGTRVRLGRAQRLELARMLRSPRPGARLRLAGGRELCVDPATRRIRIEG
jgi:tRNA(Ile)-lysidine synthase